MQSCFDVPVCDVGPSDGENGRRAAECGDRRTKSSGDRATAGSVERQAGAPCRRTVPTSLLRRCTTSNRTAEPKSTTPDSEFSAYTMVHENVLLYFALHLGCFWRVFALFVPMEIGTNAV